MSSSVCLGRSWEKDFIVDEKLLYCRSKLFLSKHAIRWLMFKDHYSLNTAMGNLGNDPKNFP